MNFKKLSLAMLSLLSTTAFASEENSYDFFVPENDVAVGERSITITPLPAFEFEGQANPYTKYIDGEFVYEDPNPSTIFSVAKVVSLNISAFPRMYPWYESGSAWIHRYSDPDLRRLSQLGKYNGILKSAPFTRGVEFVTNTNYCGTGFDHTHRLNRITRECNAPRDINNPPTPRDTTVDFPRQEGDEGWAIVVNGRVDGDQGSLSEALRSGTTGDNDNFEYSLGLSFFLDLLRQERLVGTDVYSLDLRRARSESDLIPRLKLNERQRGYQLIRNREIGIGVGFNTSLQFPNLPGITIGMMPFAGRHIRTSQTALTKDQARDLPVLDVPYDADELEDWKPGDALLYNARGGIIFTAGVGLGSIFSLGATYTAEGEWGYTVHKLTEKEVVVHISSGKVNTVSLGISAGHILTFASLNVQKFKAINEGFSFVFNLADDDTKDAYEELMRGNITPAQRMVVDNQITTVLPLSDVKSKKIGRSINSYFGLPFIFSLRSGRSHVFSANQTRFHPNNTVSNIYYGTYSENSNSLFFRSVESREFVFNANTFDTTAVGGTVIDEAHSAEFFWIFDETSMSRRELYQNIRGITKKTGFRKDIQVIVEGKYAPVYDVRDEEAYDRYWNESFGDTTISLSGRLTRLATDQLIEMAEDSTDSRQFEALSRGFVEAYFDEWPRKDRNGVCKFGEWDGGADLNRGDICAYRVDRETRDAAKDMVDALRRMGRYQDTNKKKEFVEAYADFGKAMATNQFTFQAVFHLVKDRHGLDLELKVTGENLPHVEKKIDWLPDYRGRF